MTNSGAHIASAEARALDDDAGGVLTMQLIGCYTLMACKDLLPCSESFLLSHSNRLALFLSFKFIGR